MGILEKLGLLLILGGCLLAIYTGNLFGFSNDIQKEIKALKEKEDRASREKLLYYKINEAIRRFWPVTVMAGAVLFIIGLFL